MTSSSPNMPIAFSGNIFITGASGFIGKALARRCREMGAQVTGLDFKADPENGVIGGDLTRPVEWHKALAGIDLVIHTAAIVSNTASMDQAWRVNVAATADLLECCRAAGVKRFLQLSSVAAYGFAATEALTELQPLRPMGNTYVDTKIASEHIVLATHASGAMDCTIVRPGDVYGPGSRPWVILPLEMIKSGKFLLPAQGNGLFSPVYIDDLIDGILLAAIKPEGRGQIFNISGGIEPSCAEYFGYLAQMAGSRAPRTMGTTLARALAELARRLIELFGGQTELGGGTIDMLSRQAGYSVDKAKQILGYEPTTSLEDGMRRTADWAGEQGLL